MPIYTEAKRINVAFAIDNNYPIFTLLAINSILKNNYSNSEYTFYIIENNITPKNKSKMKHYVTDKWRQEIKFVNIDISKIDKGYNFYKFSDNRITNIAMARIALTEILPKNINRVIYLDGDILATEDLLKLYETDLKNKPIGLVTNLYPAKYKNFNKKYYYNSGVILMDLGKCRKDKITSKLINYLDAHSQYFILNEQKPIDENYLYPDQDLINIVLKNDITTLDNKWNNQIIRGEQHTQAAKCIYHYIGPAKPWLFSTSNKHKPVREYINYWDKSDLKIYKYYYKMIAQYNKIKVLSKSKIYRYINIFSKTKKTY